MVKKNWNVRKKSKLSQKYIRNPKNLKYIKIKKNKKKIIKKNNPKKKSLKTPKLKNCQKW